MEWSLLYHAQYMLLLNGPLATHIQIKSAIAPRIHCRHLGYLKWQEGERGQLRYLRKILGHMKKSPTASVYLEADILPLKARRDTIMLKLWANILRTPKSHYLSHLYQTDTGK